MQQKTLWRSAHTVAAAVFSMIVLSGCGPDSKANLPPEVAQAWAMVDEKGCSACHTRDGSAGIGPSWKGAWGSERQFSDGTSAMFDAAYLRQSVTDPAARVVQGFQNLMLPAALTEAEFAQLELLLQYLAQPATTQ